MLVKMLVFKYKVYTGGKGTQNGFFFSPRMFPCPLSTLFPVYEQPLNEADLTAATELL